MSLEYSHSFFNLQGKGEDEDQSDTIGVLSYLALQRVGILQHVKELSVVDLEQHPCDLAGEVRMLALKESISEENHNYYCEK